MGTLSFCNDGVLDMGVVTTLGVSVKKTTSPIGYFGTGLKMAIATLLRTQHRIEIWSEGVRHELSVRPEMIRGEAFGIIYLDGERLGYTTQMGRNWQVWQAYRELYSNALDEENGMVTDQEVDPRSRGVCIQVTGHEIMAAWADRDTIFCSSRVVHCLPGIGEIREGASRYVYYRGVRAMELQEPSQYTWNILASMTLTEDRTIAHTYMVDHYMAKVFASVPILEVAKSMMVVPERSPEGRLEYSSVYGSEVSSEFMEAARLSIRSAGVHQGIRRLFQSVAPREEVWVPSDLTEEEQRLLDDARAVALAMDPSYTERQPAIVVDDLGPGFIGVAHGGRAYIARSCLTMGLNMLAGTLYEEFLHLERGLSDESRSMQNHIINQLASNARRDVPIRVDWREGGGPAIGQLGSGEGMVYVGSGGGIKIHGDGA